MTTGGPDPIGGCGGSTLVLLPPPIRPNSHVNVRKPRIAMTTTRNLSLRSRLRNAYGTDRPPRDWRAAYGGGRDVLRGGIAKCITPLCAAKAAREARWRRVQERGIAVGGRCDSGTRKGYDFMLGM
jgi:hypothetical protein